LSTGLSPRRPAAAGRPLESVNSLIADLVPPALDVRRVIGASRNGTSPTHGAEVEGKALEGEFASHWPNRHHVVYQRVLSPPRSRGGPAVGTEGKLGGPSGRSCSVRQPGKTLTDASFHGRQLTSPCATSPMSPPAVAKSIYPLKSPYVKVEILSLKKPSTPWWTNTIFASGDARRSARWGRHRGTLGGRSAVHRVAGIWKD